MGHHLVMDSLRKCWQNWEAIHGPLGAVVLREAQGISMALRCVYAQVPWMARATNTIHKLTPHAASAKVLNQWPAGTAHSPGRGRSATQTADYSHAPLWSQRCQSFGLCATQRSHASQNSRESILSMPWKTVLMMFCFVQPLLHVQNLATRPQIHPSRKSPEQLDVLFPGTEAGDRNGSTWFDSIASTHVLKPHVPPTSPITKM